MTASILNDCLLLRNEPTEKFIEYFKAINVTIFDTILSRKQVEGNTIQEQEPKQTVLFILTTYSEDSPLVILRQDAKEEKEGICEYLNIPDYMRDRLINLTDPIVRTATTKYLEQFAGFEFKNLMFMKIQLNDFERDITNRQYSSSKTESAGEDDNGMAQSTITYYYDIKEHGKAIAESLRLAKAIHSLENKIKSEGRFSAIEDLKEWKMHGKGKTIKVGKGGISIENSSLIRKQSNG